MFFAVRAQITDMKSTNLIAFLLAGLMYAIAAVEIVTGVAVGGRAGHQQRIGMHEQPVKFWTIVAIPVVIGTLALLAGTFSVLRNRFKN